MRLRGEALEQFVAPEIIEQLGAAQAQHNKPREPERERQRQPAHPRQRAIFRRAARLPLPGQRSGERHHEGHRPFRQKAEPHRGEEQPVAPIDECGDRGGRPESQRHVRREQPREREKAEARDEHERAAFRHLRAEEPATDRHGEQDHAERRESRGQTRGPFIEAKRAQAQRRGPVEQRRFLEMLEAVQGRHEPFAARRHLAADLGVAPFVGLIEAARAEEKREHGECENEPGVALKLGPEFGHWEWESAGA